MKSLFFIPARGNSKRLPNKNIKLFNGIPLVNYSIAFALFNNASKIILSTDNDEIINLVNGKYPLVEIIKRPKNLSGDLVSSSAVAIHCLKESNKRGFYPDVFITLQPTNPLRDITLYEKALNLFEIDRSTVFSVTENRHKLVTIENEVVKASNYSYGSRSQDMNQSYYENGQIYLTDPAILLEKGIFGNKCRAIVTDELYGLCDIDYEMDFKIGQFLHSEYSNLFNYLNDFL
jgi:CMP-N-acetylneuraminic acid synthetase